MALQLSLAVCDYDRTRAIFDGRAKVEGCDVTAVALEPEESFHRAFKFNEFDISEISLMSNSLNLKARWNASSGSSGTAVMAQPSTVARPSNIARVRS